MKRYFKGSVISLFLLLLLFGGIAVHSVVQSQANGKLINYVGIVRGATQRLVKLELAGEESDELITYLDGILAELSQGRGDYGLPAPDDRNYRQDLAKLCAGWKALKEDIRGHRSGTVDAEALLEHSEEYYRLANDTVFAAEAYSLQKTRSLLKVCIGMLAVTILTWMCILYAFSKNFIKLEQKNQTLSDLARRDALTGVYLIDAFQEKAQAILDSALGEKFAAVSTDFESFQYINEVFGYHYGDRILARYGEILQEDLGDKELSGRVSADSFVLLLRYDEKKEVARRQKRADEEIQRFLQESQAGQVLPTCCGICCVEDVVEELSIEGLLDRANFARKTVKKGSQQNYIYYDDSIRRRLWEERDVENRLEEALQNREFTVYYQPKVCLATGKIGCAEALVRWIAKDNTVIPPDRFIPVFERKLLIDQLDQYVMEEVCRWLRSCLDAGKPVKPVSVNVSRLQFYDPGFVGRYAEIRDRYAIPPELLEIEFTESTALDHAGLLERTMRGLKEKGFACSIDDFGKGYSSLSLLKSLPIDELKIDRFFFTGDTNRERDMAVVQGIVELVKKFNIKTVAEGVEDADQVEFLKRIGCDYVQGFVFYRPLPQPEYERLLGAQYG